MNCYVLERNGLKKYGFILLFSFYFAGYGQQSYPEIRYLGIENGLSNNAVTAIYQDYNGFMWFGTYDGLNKYNGYSFKIFRNKVDDTTSLRSNNIYTIEGDAYHNIWVGTQKGISIYNPVTAGFSFPKFLLSNNGLPKSIEDDVHSIEAVGGSYMLVGTQHHGLFVFKSSSDAGIQIPLYGPKGREENYTVTDIEFDSLKKVVYVLVANKGLYKCDLAKKTLQLASAAITDANCLKADNKGNLWVGLNNGLCQYDAITNTFSKNYISSNNNVVRLWTDKKGILWIASDGGGLWSLPVGSKEAVPFLSPAGIPLVNSNAVYAIYEDFDGRKWIGTLRGGINMIESRPSSFEKVIYNRPDRKNLIDNFILSFCEDGNNLWIGTDGAGLRYWDRQNNKFSEYTNNPANTNSISSNFITSITKDYQQDLWLSTWFGGINRLRKSAGSFEHYTCFNPVTKSVENNVWLIYEDAQKRLWASTTNEGTLYLLNRQTNRFELFDEKLSNIQCLAEDSEGSLWAGNYTTLTKIDPIKKQYLSYNIGYPIRSIREDKDHNFWLGTQGGGLLLFDRKSGNYKRFTTTDGLASSTVLRLLEDSMGNIWMSTYNGLSKLDIKKKTFRNFSQSDGLQSNQFSFNAGLRLHTGELVFGGIKGFNVFNPDRVYEEFETPKVFITGLKINNVPVEEDGIYVTERKLDQVNKITLPYNQAVLSLDFVALEYSGTDKIKYAYYLQGWDKDWNYVNDIRTANYSRLREGDYVFKIKISTPDGKWSDETRLLKIIVLPPWYRTWWAYLLYFSMGVSIVYLYMLYKTRQEKLRYEVKIAHIEAEKEKELNEKKMLFFTNISHEFRTPLSLIINPIKDILNKNDAHNDNQELNIIYRNARRLLRLVDQLLLFRKTDSEMGKLNMATLDLYDLCKEVYSCFVQQARAKKINYELEFENKATKIFGDREKIEIALFNLLSNAFKYTPENGNVRFRVIEYETGIEITISDTGPGIPAGIGDKLFERFYQVKENTAAAGGFGIGLYLVKSFIEAHGGKISYKSKEGEGSVFCVTLKKEIAAVASVDPAKMVNTGNSLLLNELNDDENVETLHRTEQKNDLDILVADQQSVLIIDDDEEIRRYLVSIFNPRYKIYEASNGEDGIKLAHEQLPDIIISDIVMKGIGGIDLCKNLKEDATVSHIPVILLTGSSSEEFKLKGIESGADDYITKPFDKNLLMARVAAILKGRTTLQKYFYSEITLQTNNLKVSAEYKEFLEKCIQIVESHLDDANFSIKTLASEIGMSHSSLYKKVKSISGQSVASFIRFIRLRKAAEILIHTENNINQTADMVGFNDIKYFRKQFHKLFELNPSDYIKKFRKPVHNTHHITINRRG
ncbi:MAG: two-component hybrid sensor and regulator [Ferruginibacter sp.]|nr:two-component hybrid sensor and regulator [Ferruginibacter sp.]